MPAPPSLRCDNGARGLAGRSRWCRATGGDRPSRTSEYAAAGGRRCKGQTGHCRDEGVPICVRGGGRPAHLDIEVIERVVEDIGISSSACWTIRSNSLRIRGIASNSIVAGARELSSAYGAATAAPLIRASRTRRTIGPASREPDSPVSSAASTTMLGSARLA